MLRKAAALSFSIFVALPLFARAQTAGFEPCVTASTVSFGLSVTRALWGEGPGYATLVNGIEAYGHFKGDSQASSPGAATVPQSSRAYGMSPVRYIVKALGGKDALVGVSTVAHAFPKGDEDIGSSQVVSLLRGKERWRFDRATLLVGVDAFYWDAVFRTCGYGNGRGVETWISALIRESRDAGKVLVLGTVPVEEEKNVRISSDRTGIPGLWYPPYPRCSASINAVIYRECTAANRCYIADLRETVERLNRGEKLKLNSDGQAYGLYDLRPDGIHLSDKGTRYLSQLVMTNIVANPPTCPKAPSALDSDDPMSEFNH